MTVPEQHHSRIERRIVAAVSRFVQTAEKLVRTVSPRGRGETADTDRRVAKLAWPIALAQLGDAAMGLVDAKLVGSLGAAALGGVGLGLVLMYLAYAVVYGLMRGVKIRTAHAVGRGAPEDGHRYAEAGVLLGLVLGLVVLAAGQNLGWALEWLGASEEIRAHGSAFLAAVTWGAPGTFVTAALVQHRQALGDARTPLLVSVGGNILNAVLAFALIHGHLGLPALGVAGAGYATAASQVTQAAVLLFVLRGARPKRPSVKTLSAAAREVADLGLPTGVQFAAEMLALTAFTVILSSLGAVEIAAHQVALSVIRVSFLPGIALGEAASVLVGQALGGGDLRAADRVVKSALKQAAGIMGLCAIVFGVFGHAIASAFVPDPEVALVVVRLLLVAAAFQLLDAVNIVLRGALRGAKDVRTTAILGVAIVWTCVPTSAYFLGEVLGWGAVGGWVGFIFETVVASIVFSWRWLRGSWRTTHAAQHASVSSPVAEASTL